MGRTILGTAEFDEQTLGSTYDEHVDDQSDDEVEANVERLWATEIERRADRVLTGESRGEPWATVRHRIEQELSAK